jgi:hypothetical protein
MTMTVEQLKRSSALLGDVRHFQVEAAKFREADRKVAKAKDELATLGVEWSEADDAVFEDAVKVHGLAQADEPTAVKIILAPNNVFCRGMTCGVCGNPFSSKDSAWVETRDDITLQFATTSFRPQKKSRGIEPFLGWVNEKLGAAGGDLVCDECAEKHAPEQLAVLRELAGHARTNQEAAAPDLRDDDSLQKFEDMVCRGGDVVSRWAGLPTGDELDLMVPAEKMILAGFLLAHGYLHAAELVAGSAHDEWARRRFKQKEGPAEESADDGIAF